MDGRKSALERAFQLAVTGQCRTVEEIRFRLKSEGYANGQITGQALTTQLRALMKDSDAHRT